MPWDSLTNEERQSQTALIELEHGCPVKSRMNVSLIRRGDVWTAELQMGNHIARGLSQAAALRALADNIDAKN